MPSQRTCLRLDNLTLGYGTRPAVHGLTGDVAHGSLLAVVGPNGSGKSTLLKGIVGMLAPMGGECEQMDACRMAYLPQQADIDRTFPATVYDLVSLGLWPKRGLLGRITGQDKSLIDQALDAVGLRGFEKRPIDTLSGGQLQRALFARVLLQNADLILLDEPFNAIDTKTVDDLIGVIKRWHGENRTIIAVIHDIELVRDHFPEALLLSREPIAWGRTSDVLRAENLLKARQFNAAWDEDAAWCSDQDHDHSDGKLALVKSEGRAA